MLRGGSPLRDVVSHSRASHSRASHSRASDGAALHGPPAPPAAAHASAVQGSAGHRAGARPAGTTVDDAPRARRTAVRDLPPFIAPSVPGGSAPADSGGTTVASPAVRRVQPAPASHGRRHSAPVSTREPRPAPVVPLGRATGATTATTGPATTAAGAPTTVIPAAVVPAPVAPAPVAPAPIVPAPIVPAPIVPAAVVAAAVPSAPSAGPVPAAVTPSALGSAGAEPAAPASRRSARAGTAGWGKATRTGTAVRVPAGTPGVHHVPAPPTASLHGRAMVAAVAAGAVVAAGQTLIAPFADAEPVTVSAMLPVAEITTAAPAPGPAVNAIGGDQLLPDTQAIGALDPASQVDVQNLAKAVDIGTELAHQAALIDAALADGASEAHLTGDTAYVRPAVGRLTSLFGGRWGAFHYGIDIANSIGTPIYALTDATVEEAGPASGFGLWVVLRHSDGTQSVYGHVNRMFVKVGQKVRAGEEIAEIGNRGESTGPHLHLEIWDADGTKINPIPWLLKHGIGF